MFKPIILILFLYSGLFAQKFQKVYKLENGVIKISEAKISSLKPQNKPIDGLKYHIEYQINNVIIEKEEPIGGLGIVNTWLADIDGDGKPEVYLYWSYKGSGGYSDIAVYEIDGYEMKKIQFPKLDSFQNQYFMGHNDFYIKDDILYQEYPAYNKDDANCCPSAGKMVIKYALIDDKLVVSESKLKETPESIARKQKTSILIIQHASGLPRMDRASESDTWFRVFIEDEQLGSSEIIKNDSNPRFNKSVELIGYSGQVVRIELFDKDLTKNELIGVVKLKELKSGEYPILYETKSGDTKVRGMLKIIFTKE